jgi:hypothetical protein
MVRQQSVLNAEMLQQDTRRASIFSQDNIGFFQDTDGTHRHVFHISYGCRNKIQYAHTACKGTASRRQYKTKTFLFLLLRRSELSSKVRLSEDKAKGKLVFLFIVER